MTHFMLGLGATGTPGNDAFTKILLHMDGDNGGTSFPDVNGAGISATWSRSGSVTTSTTSPKFGSACYLGSGYIVSNQSSATYHPGSSAWTIDFWFRGTTSGSSVALSSFYGTSGTGGGPSCLDIYKDTSNNIRLAVISMGVAGVNVVVAASSFLDNNWHHYAAVRSGDTLYVFIDGVYRGGTGFSGSVNSGTYSWYVGGAPTIYSPWPGGIDEFRYSLGIARWTSNFTPPPSPYI